MSDPGSLTRKLRTPDTLISSGCLKPGIQAAPKTSWIPRSSTLVKWACLLMGIATAKMAIDILLVGRLSAYVDQHGVFHGPVVGLATQSVAQEWGAVTAVLWLASLASRLFWEHPEEARLHTTP